MGISGFILDLLVPGLVAVAVGWVVAVEFRVDPTDDLSSTGTTVLLTGVVVAAYLVGIAIRHSVRHLQGSNERIFRARLAEQWPQHLPSLRSRWLDETERNDGDGREDPPSVAEAGQIVGRIEEYYLATTSEAWGEHLHYNRNIARVASNSLYPLLLLVFVSAVAAVRRGFDEDFGIMGWYLVGAAAGLSVAAGLRTAHRKRMQWFVDKLVRTDIAHQLRADR